MAQVKNPMMGFQWIFTFSDLLCPKITFLDLVGVHTRISVNTLNLKNENQKNIEFKLYNNTIFLLFSMFSLLFNN